jgi:hypothetical protein
MRARGYGSGRRTAFASYKLRRRDVARIVVLAALFVANGACILLLGGKFSFFPFFRGLHGSPFPYLLYGVLLLYPLISECAEGIKRKSDRRVGKREWMKSS